MGRKIVEGLKVAGLKVGEKRGSFALGSGFSDSLTLDFWTFRRPVTS
jgi:hypothetical protein